ncbi:IS1 family transposase [Lewinella lacunae]|uniref:IS1 family transposase n=3 Tax=Neolewinella lacunae TaxID=1517758 RepID=A0A923T9J3_9BACT|nr:IS1 family transposase [Neolewinella lacunae]
MYGKTHHQKQRFRCKDCNRQFVVDNGHLISKEKRGYIERLLSERVSLRGICRSMEVSMTWLMNFAASIWEQTLDNLGVDYELLENLSDEELQSVEIQLDEMWSFVGCKKNKRWIWVVYCPAIKQVLAFHVGGRGVSPPPPFPLHSTIGQYHLTAQKPQIVLLVSFFFVHLCD